MARAIQRIMHFDGQQGKSLEYCSETCHWQDFSSPEAEGRDFSQCGISSATKSTASTRTSCSTAHGPALQIRVPAGKSCAVLLCEGMLSSCRPWQTPSPQTLPFQGKVQLLQLQKGSFKMGEEKPVLFLIL